MFLNILICVQIFDSAHFAVHRSFEDIRLVCVLAYLSHNALILQIQNIAAKYIYVFTMGSTKYSERWELWTEYENCLPFLQNISPNTSWVVQFTTERLLNQSYYLGLYSVYLPFCCILPFLIHTIAPINRKRSAGIIRQSNAMPHVGIEVDPFEMA